MIQAEITAPIHRHLDVEPLNDTVSDAAEHSRGQLLEPRGRNRWFQNRSRSRRQRVFGSRHVTSNQASELVIARACAPYQGAARHINCRRAITAFDRTSLDSNTRLVD